MKKSHLNFFHIFIRSFIHSYSGLPKLIGKKRPSCFQANQFTNYYCYLLIIDSILIVFCQEEERSEIKNKKQKSIFFKIKDGAYIMIMMIIGWENLNDEKNNNKKRRKEKKKIFRNGKNPSIDQRYQIQTSNKKND